MNNFWRFELPREHGDWRSAAADGWKGTRDSVVNILQSLSREERQNNLDSMDWVPEWLVTIWENSVIVWGKEFLFIDDTTFTQDEAIRNGAMRKWAMTDMFKALTKDKAKFTDFCERVFGLQKWQKYRTSSGWRRGDDIVSFNSDTWIFMASSDNSVDSETSLPTIIIRDI